MIPNIVPCCCYCCCCNQCSAPNQNYYLQITNQSAFYVNATLYYTLHGNRITKPYPLFGPGKMQRVPIPSGATGVDFDLYNCFFNPPHLICNKSIPSDSSSCFIVQTNQEGYTNCIPVPC